MKNWREVLVYPWTSIIQAVELIDKSTLQIALIVDQANYLLGTVTDGDIRRGLIRGVSLTDQVDKIMNVNPTTLKLGEAREKVLTTMKQKRLHHLPVIDDGGHVVGLEILDDLLKPEKKDNWVVIMAGGLGTRLDALTADCPKPLLKVGAKPLLETIINTFKDYGFHKFYIAVNYKAEMIKQYFSDGSLWEVEIHYIHEKQRMGTAGALGLLPEKPAKPFFVMNGDLLTKINFQHLLDFHLEQGSKATMCVKDHEYQIPYGVVMVEDYGIKNIKEKPMLRFLINAGVYILDPEVIDIIPKQTYHDMTSLFNNLINLDFKTSVFPIREYWLDIGKKSDFEQANDEFLIYFAQEELLDI